ncbi:MAG: acyl-CoA dehydrogenase family protein [Actinobacteria bacterium]|nr:acyl-CoA dehydrogenase family protein [Actinomycetota bacterium]MBU1942719.1 acyl-CoA dehydrogenase family protein [Actinomycetota bacterium]MBU2686041.1 acyl-CoA dehydrogenase family protein [Actinomycetota bacterium]
MEFDLNEEQTMFRQMVREFADKEIAPYAEELDGTGEFPYEIQAKMADLGLYGLPIPEEYGGAGADFVTYSIAVEEIGRVSASLSISMAAHTSLGSMPIYLFGTEEQKQRWLVDLAQGRKLGAFGLTEPEAGSDAGATRTTARLAAGEWVINGTKCFITNSGTDITSHVTITAVTGEHGGGKEISNILIPAGTPGFDVAPSYRKMGWHNSDTHELSFTDCRVPEGHLLGERGGGFKAFLKILDCGRIGVAALSVGLAQGCLDESVSYAKSRIQFGQPIGRNQGISFKCADMLVEVELARLATLKAAWLADQGRPYTREAAIAKLFASEAAMRAANSAVQIHGGYGYIEDYPVCRYFRDAKILEIGEGTSEVQRIVLSRMLGL